ncbi:hypothetical protein PR003_g9109 [Phytophthora rubi]|uniref:HSF-type DNA-binding domain-containing protein n=1 Tax=Phytophthora rubi TaxID=129364 RepID=A0A6A4FF96_9STRA|nr:hypothetical protein PR002_g8812 [Phytophthora rubi]KAE9037357.1 hypothetical protein PR001_g8419 [Phytophthora rubi]KAE9343203.1 hypothetical protein PR003_g9109 [Phytophthora rubi]
MAVGIPTGFVRKLYRILDHESAAIISWDADGASFSVHDSAALDAQILPRYFRGRLCAFRQQLLDHGFARCDCEEDDVREEYRHPDFLKGQPGRLSKIERKPKRNQRKNVSAPPVETPKRISLKVTLNVPPRKRRQEQEQQGIVQPNKRLKPAEFQSPPQQIPANKAKNPLFSDDPEPGAMSLANFVEGTGLLPASSELPDPISYLSKAARNTTEKTIATAAHETTAVSMAPMFSDDLVKSTLFFLLSTSCTGVEDNGAGNARTAAATAPTAVTVTSATPPLATAMTTSTTSFLASLLASSSTGGTTAAPFARGNNPLFSDQTTDGDDDSIWNILVSSSVDRVRSSIVRVQSPEEKLRLILEEREKLEEQRKKVGAPAGPIMPKVSTYSDAPEASAVMAISRPQQQNPLFATEAPSESSNEVQREPAEDDLWKLLMSSSIDSFRRVTDLGM